MRAHLQLIQVEGIGYLQIIRAEKTDVCRSYGLSLQAETHTRKCRVAKSIQPDTYRICVFLN